MQGGAARRTTGHSRAGAGLLHRCTPRELSMNVHEHLSPEDDDALPGQAAGTHYDGAWNSGVQPSLAEELAHQMQSAKLSHMAEDERDALAGKGRTKAGDGQEERDAAKVLRQLRLGRTTAAARAAAVAAAGTTNLKEHLSTQEGAASAPRHAASAPVQAKLNDASTLTSAGHFGAAKALLQSALNIADLSAMDEKGIMLALAHCLHMHGEDAAWIEMLCRAAALDKSDSALELKIADAVFEELQYAAALAHYDAALALLRATAPAAAMTTIGARRLSKMALCAFQANDPDRAKGLCRQAIALENGNAVAEKLLKKIVSRQRRSSRNVALALTRPQRQREGEDGDSNDSAGGPFGAPAALPPPGRRSRLGGRANTVLAEASASRPRLRGRGGSRSASMFAAVGGGGGGSHAAALTVLADAAAPCQNCSAALAETIMMSKLAREVEARTSEQTQHFQRALDNAALELERIRALHAGELRAAETNTDATVAELQAQLQTRDATVAALRAQSKADMYAVTTQLRQSINGATEALQRQFDAASEVHVSNEISLARRLTDLQHLHNAELWASERRFATNSDETSRLRAERDDAVAKLKEARDEITMRDALVGKGRTKAGGDGPEEERDAVKVLRQLRLGRTAAARAEGAAPPPRHFGFELPVAAGNRNFIASRTLRGGGRATNAGFTFDPSFQADFDCSLSEIAREATRQRS